MAGKNYSRILSGITLRSIIIGTGLSIFIGISEVVQVAYLGASPMANDHTAAASIFFLFILTFFVNSIIKIFNRKGGLSTVELSLIFVMMLVACAVPSWGFSMNLVFLLAGSRYFASTENLWTETILPRIPRWLVPNSDTAIRYFYEGLPKGMDIPWMVWVKPLTFWCAFILMLYLLMLSLSVIFRKQWMENESLMYPLMIVPTEMIRYDGTSSVPLLYRNKLMWYGFFLALVIGSIEAINSYFPMFLPGFSLSGGVQFGPGGALGTLPLMLKFEVVGIAYLLSTDISLSLWFFTLFYFVEHVFFNRIGFSIGARDIGSSFAPAIGYQMMGAFLVFVLFSLWIARSHLFNVFKKAFSKKVAIDDSMEIFSYRQAIILLVACFVGFVIWLIATGFSPFAAIFFALISICMFLGITKIVCQTGAGYCKQPVAPGVFTLNIFGDKVGPGQSVAIAMTMPYSGDIRTSVLTTASQGLKVIHPLHIGIRKVAWAIILALVASLFSSLFTIILLGYRYGGINLGGWQPINMPIMTFNWAKEMVLHPIGFDIRRFGFLSLGGVMMLLMILLRSRFSVFILHPVGMAFAYNTPLYWVWFSFFLGWMFKALVMKYGGVRFYRESIPFFLGCIIGAVFKAGLWNIIFFLTGHFGIRLTLG